MAVFNTIIGRLAILIMVFGLGTTVDARDTDCNLDFTVEVGCAPDGTGYALVTDIVNNIGSYGISWSFGGSNQFVAGLVNNDYSVTLTDAANCTAIKYFTIDCIKKDDGGDDGKEEPCQLRTQTQGGWGAPANGNNPGAYRDAHFAAAFPGGLSIGCNKTLTLTTALAVKNFLPSGTSPKKLTQNLVNPGSSYKNVLAGQLVALTLSVGFDNYDPDFGTGGLLADAVINHGTFAGKTVQELLDAANNFIGGCASPYTAGQLNDALDMVNNNFVDGTTNNGKVDCDDKKDHPGDDKNMMHHGEMRTGDEPTGDCNLDFVVETGCAPDGTGYALVTDIVSAITPYHILWSNGAQVAFVAGLTNGDYSVSVIDAADCQTIKYFTIDCEKKHDDEDDKEEPCALRTQTQGGWGAPANGNNPGAYRNAHFAAAFPGGLTIGCNYTLTLNSAQAVQNFLPSGSTPKKLTTNLVNPGNSYKNVLAGQLVALTLSVGFDNYDPNFGTGGLLANAVINHGSFAGWTVQELLDAANHFIGGCASPYTASQLNEALTLVNENFVDGNTNKGKVDCAGKGTPGDNKALELANIADLLAFPNPASDRLNVNITANISGQVAVLLMDATGRLALPTSTVVLNSGEQRTITLDVSGLANGTYVLSLELDGQRSVQRIVIAR
ncbi:MAG: T9SS type A sorting domain-containing protein [Flavobacteriales bacterium]|nr:T9SS type A sorting domain-containing protein [Flavobacteriales bacterium]